MRLFAALARLLRKLADRIRARVLLAQRLPKGLPAAQLRPALRVPSDSFQNEYTTVQVGFEVVRGTPPRRLLRLAALPQRAPVSRIDPRAFRLDARELTWANEDGIHPTLLLFDQTWLRPSFRRDVVDLPWMARERIWGLAPLQSEWFAAWWWQKKARPEEERGPRDFEIPPDLPELMERVKEQMLIRRDVAKDEHPPDPAPFDRPEGEPPISSHARPNLPDLVPPKEWPAGQFTRIESAVQQNAADDAYLQWRVLMDAIAGPSDWTK
jgi:hypothetical protein